MKKHSSMMQGVVVALACCGLTTSAVTLSAEELYRIASGSYVVTGGFAGEVTTPLPILTQAFVRLRVDPQTGDAELNILDEALNDAFLILTNGIVGENQIRFLYEIADASDPGSTNVLKVDYTVDLLQNALQFHGSIQGQPRCCDIPYIFTHMTVHALLNPVVGVQISEVTLIWPTASGFAYQVQYRSQLTSDIWINLGETILGTGSFAQLADKIVAGEPKRFYRVVADQVIVD